MKGLSIKKLAAIATGAALVGSALAPIVSAQVTKDDIYSADGTPKVNIVVGAAAQISDAIWAGNIAAKIAEKATSATDVTCTGEVGAGACTTELGDITVDLTIGGETSYSTEDSKTYDENYLDTNSLSGPEYVKELKQAQLNFLYNSTDTYRYAGTSYTTTMKEMLGIKADAQFEKAKEVMDLVVYFDDAHDFNYTLDLGQGVPITESATQVPGGNSSNKFTDGSNDHIAVPWFGEKYIINQIDCSSSSAVSVEAGKCIVELIKEAAEEVYNEGDEITGLIGRSSYEGEDVTVKVVAITQAGAAATTYSAKFEIYDAEGTKVDTVTVGTGVYLNTNFLDSEGDYVLDTVLYLSDISVGSTTQVGTVTITKGTNVAEIKNGKEYPYDSTDTNSENDYWLASMTFSTDSSPDVNVLKTIQIYNNLAKWNKSKGPLYSTDDCLTSACETGTTEAIWLDKVEDAVGYGFAKVRFDGFKEDKTYHAVEIGEGSCTTGSSTIGCVKWTDNSGNANNIPMAIKLELTEEVSTFTVDDQTYYYKCNQTGEAEYTDFNVVNTDTLNGWIVKVDSDIDQDPGSGDQNAIIVEAGVTDANYVAGAVIYIKSEQYTVQGVGDNNVMLRADGNCSFASTSLSTDPANATYLSPSNLTETMASGPYKSIYYKSKPTYGPIGCRDTNNQSLALTGGVEDNTHYYAVYVNEADGDLWLLLDDQTQFRIEEGVSSGDDFNMVGSDTDLFGGTVEDTIIDANETCFIPDDDSISGADAGDNDYFVATFLVDDDGDGKHDARVQIDTEDGKYIDLPNNQLNQYTNDVNFVSSRTSGNPNANPENWILRDDDATKYPSAAYSDFGSKYWLDGGIVKVSIPDTPPYISVTVIGEGAVVTTTGGETLEDIALGDTAETSTGTKITVDDVDSPCTCEVTAEGGECAPSITSCVAAAGDSPEVFLDTDNPAGTKIIVGGQIVNRLAAQITGLADRLTSPASAPILEVDTATGNIIVAGYTAGQTGEAAQDMIDLIDGFA